MGGAVEGVLIIFFFTGGSRSDPTCYGNGETLTPSFGVRRKKSAASWGVVRAT